MADLVKTDYTQTDFLDSKAAGVLSIGATNATQVDCLKTFHTDNIAGQTGAVVGIEGVTISPSTVTFAPNVFIDHDLSIAGTTVFSFDGGDRMEYDKAANTWCVRMNGNPNPDIRVTQNADTEVIGLDTIQADELVLGRTDATMIKSAKRTSINTSVAVDPAADVDLLIQKTGNAQLVLSADSGGVGGTNSTMELVSMAGQECIRMANLGAGDGVLDIIGGGNLVLRTGGTLGLWTSGGAANITVQPLSAMTLYGLTQSVGIHNQLLVDNIDEFTPASGVTFPSEIYLANGASPLNWYEFNTTKVAVFGGPFAVAQNCTLHQTRIGNTVFLTIEQVIAAGAVSAIAAAPLGSIDANFRPVSFVEQMVVRTYDNGAYLAAAGLCEILADGSINISLNGTQATNWTNTGNNGWDTFCVTYNII